MPQNIYKSLGFPPEIADIADAESRTPPSEDEGGGEEGGGGLSPGGLDIKAGNGALDATKGSHVITSGTSFTLPDGAADKDFHSIYNATANLVIISHKSGNDGTPQAGANIYLYSFCTAAVEWNDTIGGYVRRQAIQFPSAPAPQVVPGTSQVTEDGEINASAGHWFLNGGDAFTIANPDAEDVVMTIRNNTGGEVTLTANFYKDDTVIESLILPRGAYLFLQWNQNKWIVKMVALETTSSHEFRSSAGAISNSIAHTDLHNDGSGTCTLADGVYDGFEKTIRVAAGVGTPFTITVNFFNLGSLSGVGSNIVMAASSSIRLVWAEDIERYIVRAASGTITFNIGGGS